MRSFTLPLLVLAMLGLFSLTGCGGSSTTTSDPLQRTTGTSPSQPTDGNNYTLSLVPSKPQALTNEEQIVTATLKDANGKAVAGQKVSFSITAGPASSLTTVMRTDSNGVALAFVRTGTTSATTNVIVQGSAAIGGSNVVGYGNFQVSPGDAAVTSTKLSLSPNTFEVKPNEQLVLTATAKDSSGNALANQAVNFLVSAGPATMLTTTATTDSNGTAVALVQAGDAAAIANVIVQASTTVNSNQIAAVVPFQVVPQSSTAQSYTLTMTPSKETVDNNEDFYVTATLQDSAGNPVSGTPITFSMATGPATINTPSVTTDSTGKAIATIRAGSPSSTTAIIIEASAEVNGTQATALSPVQIATKILSASMHQMTLSADNSTVGSNADVILTATVTDLQAPATPMQNQAITFTVAAGPGTIIDSTATTDSTGKAVSRLKVGTINSSSSIIVQASTTVNGNSLTAYSTISVVRQNSYVINFITTKTTTDPDGNLNFLSATLPPDATGLFEFKQLVPFQVLDNNGVPMPGVNVSIEVYNTGRNPDTSIQLVPPLPGPPVTYPPNRTIVTVTTDDHGMGIFTCNVILAAPGHPGGYNAESIIYSATATIENINLLSYGGFLVKLTQSLS